MICPRCGYDMGNKSMCLRCGYEVKTLAVVDSQSDENNKNSQADEEVIETKIIDPCNVFLTHPYGYDDGFGTSGFGGPFSSIFDELFGDPISDLLGGLFGINLGGGARRRTTVREDDPPRKKRKQGPIVEVRDVEIIEDGANSNSATDSHNAKHDNHGSKKRNKKR